MKSTFWRSLAIGQAVCIVVLLVAGAWWMQRVRLQTRTATLRALYDFLAPPPERHGVYTPVVVDVNFDQKTPRYFVNGEAMDSGALARFVRSALQSDDALGPFVIRTKLDTPFPKIAAAMQVLIENGVKVLGLPMDEGLLVLTDRGFAPRDDVSMPESFPGLE